jgi:signal transduction histidine kinase
MLLINSQMFQILKRQETFNLFYAQLDIVDKGLFTVVRTGDHKEITLCRESLELLCDYAEQLEVKYGTREFVDLRNMTETYEENVSAAVNQRLRGDLMESIQEYEKAAYIRDLILDRYGQVSKHAIEENRRIQKSLQNDNRFLMVILCFLMSALAFFGFRYAHHFAKQFVNEYKEKIAIERKLKEEELRRFKTEALLHENELRLMQARINPHFLFNTLNMVSQNAYMENANSTLRITTTLASLLRYSLNSLDRVVLLSEEVDNIRDYFFIQEQRFGPRFTFNIDFPERCNKAAIPSLILQPLVENAVIHGFKKNEIDMLIGIETNEQQGRITIRIFDNGQGMSVEKTARLNDLTRSHQKASNDSMGIYNVSTRLKLFFEDDVKIRFTSIPDTYTEVLLEFPMIIHEKVENVPVNDNRR